MATSKDRPVLYFDGVCNLCTTSVQFAIKHDRKKQFLFAPLQSTVGQKALSEISGNVDSIVLFYRNRYYIKSTAVLNTAKLLGGVWSLFYVFIVIPRFIRDYAYDTMAKKRYKWFGKKNECMVPTPEIRSRFLS